METKTANIAWEEGDFNYINAAGDSVTLPATDGNGNRLVMVRCGLSGGERDGYYVGYVSPNTDAAAVALAAAIIRDHPVPA